MEIQSFIILASIVIIAALYSSVGHGGASGYLAMMALLSIAPEVIRPAALTLNLFVASIATVQYYRAGHFSWRVFAPFAAASVPLAFIGGMIQLPTTTYKIVLGIVLIAAAVRLAWNLQSESDVKEPAIWISLIIGALIGLLSGLVGVGGGIFLTPILLLLHWAKAKTAAGVSALFILVNSAAGLAGNYEQVSKLPATVWMWVAAAIIGGIIGATLGSRRFDSIMLRRVLAAVLLFAGSKLIFV